MFCLAFPLELLTLLGYHKATKYTTRICYLACDSHGNGDRFRSNGTSRMKSIDGFNINEYYSK